MSGQLQKHTPTVPHPTRALPINASVTPRSQAEVCAPTPLRRGHLPAKRRRLVCARRDKPSSPVASPRHRGVWVLASYRWIHSFLRILLQQQGPTCKLGAPLQAIMTGRPLNSPSSFSSHLILDRKTKKCKTLMEMKCLGHTSKWHLLLFYVLLHLLSYLVIYTEGYLFWCWYRGEFVPLNTFCSWCEKEKKNISTLFLIIDF